MKKKLFLIAALLISPFVLFAQKVAGRLKFNQGQEINISMHIKTNISQEAMGQAIDFDLDGVSNHDYKVTNATEDNFTLHHEVKKIGFNFDGMGQKRNFDSDKEKDMDGQFGKPIKELLGKSYDMIIDPTGKVLMVQPEKIEMGSTDPRMAIITNMLTDIISVVMPPQKGRASFFDVLPGYDVSKGDSWSDTTVNATIKSITRYKIADITDSTINLDVSGYSETTTKAEMMGNETITTLKNNSTGKIIIDRNTGIIKESNSTIESSGTTQVMGSSLPVTSKTSIDIKIN